MGYGGANYSISQDITGTMYFGNFNGILLFNNHRWERIDFPGKPLLYKNRVGELYVGGYNIIARVFIDNTDRPSVISLLDSVTDFGQVTSIELFRNQVFFVANNTLYKISQEKAIPIVTDKKHLKIFTYRDVLFVATSKNLFQYSQKSLTPLYNNAFKNNPVLDIFRFANSIMFRTHTQFYTLSATQSIQVFKTDIDKELQLYGYTCSQRLSNNTLVIGTRSNGLYFIGSNGELLNYLSVETGLRDNTIHDLFVDRANNLWLGFNSGIARIEVPSAFTYFSAQQGLLGNVHAVVRHNNHMYFGTESGIFKLVRTRTSMQTFQKIGNQHVSCNVLVSHNNFLFAGTDNGLLVIKDNAIQQVHPIPTNALCYSQSQSSLWVASSNYIYNFFISESGYLSLMQQYGPINGEIQTIAVDDLKLWIGTYFDGVYCLQDTLLEKKSIFGNQLAHDWIEVYNTSAGVVFSTAHGLFRYDAEIDMFFVDSKLTIPVELSNTRIRPIVEDTEKNIWFTFLHPQLDINQVAVGWNTNNLERYTLITSQFNKLSPFICNTIYPDKNSVVWFAGFNGLVRLDFRNLSTKKTPEQTYIHAIIIGTDSLFTQYKKSGEASISVFPFNLNSIRFEFAAPIYENRQDVTYSYWLQGYEQFWTYSEAINYKEYSNLPAGKYTFHVYAVDAHGNNAQTASFSFKIEKHPLLRWWAIIFYIILLLSTITVIFRWRAYQFVKEKARLSKIIKERTEELLEEKEKTEILLSNILPEETAKELKEKGRATSMRFNMATILFSDIHGFTKIAEEMNPDTLIDELDRFFLEFDRIVEKHNIEKIKTIGDAYMCAGGIPQKNRTNPIEVVVAALEMQHRMIEIQKQNQQNRKEYWGLRIGIHTGPVIAGVVGSKKFSYDIWGDSVNIASRMESSGEVGKVNVSENTYLLVQEFFDCEYRGKMPVKYKGEVDMYFVNGFKPEFSDDPNRVIPNENFKRRFALQKFEDLQDMIFERLEQELPKNLYYHNVKHAIDVLVQIEIIGKEEQVGDDDLLLLKTAALFHDAGFLLGYDDHEDLGVQLAKSVLPKYNFDEVQIQTISELIYATKLPHNPKNLLEEIICDADLDYLGRDDYFPVSRDLYRELIEYNVIKKSEYEWNKMQIKFLQHHRFFTNSCKTRRNENKNKQIRKLQEQTRSFNKINNI